MTTIQNVLILFHEEKYCKSHFIAQQLQKQLESMQKNVFLLEIPLTTIHAGKYMTQCSDFHPDLMISIDFEGSRLKNISNNSMTNSSDFQTAFLLFQTPNLFVDKLKEPIHLTNHLYFSTPAYCNYVKEWFLDVPNASCMPYTFFYDSKKNRPLSQRSIPVYLPSSYQSPDLLMEEIKQQSPVFKQLLFYVIETLRQQPFLSPVSAMLSYLKSISFSYTAQDVQELTVLLDLAVRYIKMQALDELVSSLLRAEISVTVSGTGWEAFPLQSSHLHILTESSYDAMLHTMEDTKIVLNQQFHRNSGIHDRILNALACGCICVSNPNPDIQAAFPNTGNPVFYTSPEDCVKKIQKLLQTSVHADNDIPKTESLFSLEKLCHYLLENNCKNIL